MNNRRKLLAGLTGIGGIGVASSVGVGVLGGISFPSEGCACLKSLAEWCAELEVQTKQRIGVYVISSDTVEFDFEEGHRWDEPFAMCSTFKWVLAAAVLKFVTDGALRLDQSVPFSEVDILEHAPVVRKNLPKGSLTVSELCAAAVSVSDNSAANLLLPLVGGPAGLTHFVRSLGDNVTRFDRIEPALNTNEAGDPRDTTTPKAMARLLHKVFFGDVLPPASVSLLKQWMVDATTGRDLIRSGVPKTWKAIVGDKTGRGANGALNDVAIVWSASGVFDLVCVYTTGGQLTDPERRQVLARIGRYALIKS